MSDAKKMTYADGDGVLTDRAGLVTALVEVFKTKARLRTAITSLFGEDTLFELNWTSLRVAVDTLVEFCIRGRKISHLIDSLKDYPEMRYPIMLLLGQEIIVPVAEAPIGNFKDSEAAPQLLSPQFGQHLTFIHGVFVQAFGAKERVKSFIDKVIPGARDSLDWTTTASAVRDLVDYGLRNKKFALLLEKACEENEFNQELSMALLFMQAMGVIVKR